MRTELKSFRFRCDFCNEVVDTDNGRTLPFGWLVIKTHGHGMTDYSKDNDVCPKCQETCPMCVGEKTVVRVENGPVNDTKRCPRCDGTGKVIKRDEKL